MRETSIVPEITKGTNFDHDAIAYYNFITKSSHNKLECRMCSNSRHYPTVTIGEKETLL